MLGECAKRGQSSLINLAYYAIPDHVGFHSRAVLSELSPRLTLHPVLPLVFPDQAPQCQVGALAPIAWLAEEDSVRYVVRAAFRAWLNMVELHELALQLPATTGADDHSDDTGLSRDKMVDDLLVG